MRINDKKVLITGGTGLLGKTLIETAPEGVSLFATYHQNGPEALSTLCKFYRLDLEDGQGIDELFSLLKPEAVIHTAGLGNVDYAEKEREATWRINVGGTARILKACERYGVKLIYISSNAVFDGESPPYGEEDPVNPINYYGQLKVECEEMVREGRVAWAVVRPILIYGWNHPGGRPNPVTWLIEKLQKGQKVDMVNDVYGNPLWSVNGAQAVWAVLRLGREGIYHVGGRDRVSRYDFAVRTAQVFGLDSGLIRPVDSSFFPDIAPRPRDTTYRTIKMEQDLGVRPISVEEGLQRMKESAKATRALGSMSGG